MKQPNIVLVIADDVTPAYHGCYGGPTPTPHIDRLAREGALFHQSHGSAPLCCPSRYTIFTGQYCGRAQSCSDGCSTAEPYSLSQNGDLQPDTPTLAKQLKTAGYFTGHVGKWHSNFAILGEEWDNNLLGPDADLDDATVDAKVREVQTRHQGVIKQCAGFEWVGAVNWGNLMGNRPSRLRYHNPGWMTDTALEFLEAATADERPFYLHLANTLPHGPDPSDSLGKDHRYSFSGKLDEAPCSHPHDATVFERLRAAGLQTEGPVAAINAGIIQIDDQVGALRDQLEAMGELDNTIFIYTADHGIHGKGTPYLGGYHLPLVCRWPQAVPAGREIEAQVSHVDFYPTLLEAAGAEIPETHSVDGRSYLDLLKGKTETHREVTYQEMGVARAVTKGRYRLVHFFYPESVIEKIRAGAVHPTPPSVQAYVEGPFCNYNFINKPHYFDPVQLYDREADPCERRNLAHEPAYAEILTDLTTELHAITDSLPGPYRHDVPTFQTTPAYRRLVEQRRLAVQQQSFYPEGFDQERIFNMNLPDPLI